MPAPRDIAYPGTLRLDIDASDTSRGIYRVVETIPVAGPGPLTLLYPQWLPGNHGPSGPINSLAGIRITAGGRADRLAARSGLRLRLPCRRAGRRARAAASNSSISRRPTAARAG